jgi:hypothetical protein
MQKINLTLTLMHGKEVAGWVKNVGTALNELDPDCYHYLRRVTVNLKRKAKSC